MECLVRFMGSNDEIKVIKKSNVYLGQALISGLYDEILASLLELDARLGLFAETFVVPFLMPFELECDDDEFKEYILKIANIYRKRIVLEQAYDLYVRLGPLLDGVMILPAYFPLSRLNLAWKARDCFLSNLFRHFDKEDLVNRLNGIYLRYVTELFNARVHDDYIRLKPPKVRDAFMSFMTSFKLALQSGVHKFTRGILRPKNDECKPPSFVTKPWLFMNIKEGVLAFSCPQPKDLVGGTCKAPTSLSESLICEGSQGKFVVKDYYRITMVKWIPAALASKIYGIRYRFSAKSRLAAEAKYFPLLRRLVLTPSILRICVDYRQAYMMREYVEGEPLNNIDDPRVWMDSGRILAEIHKNRLFLGDPNPGNFVIDKHNNFWLVDTEQVRRLGESRKKMEAWDILVFLFYSTFLNVDLKLVKKALEGYASNQVKEWKYIRREALRPQVWASLGVAVPNLLKAQRIIREVDF